MAKKRKKRVNLVWFGKGENATLDAMTDEEIIERMKREARRFLEEVPVRMDCVPAAFQAYLDGETLGEAADILVIDSRYWDGFPL